MKALFVEDIEFGALALGVVEAARGGVRDLGLRHVGDRAMLCL